MSISCNSIALPSRATRASPLRRNRHPGWTQPERVRNFLLFPLPFSRFPLGTQPGRPRLYDAQRAR